MNVYSSNEDCKQVWVFGLINNITRNIRMEIINDKIQETMKKIITKLITRDNIIIAYATAFIIFWKRIYRIYVSCPYSWASEF